MYFESSLSLIFFYSFFILVNDPQTLYVNPGCLKCISGINLSAVNTNLFITFKGKEVQR